MPLLSVLGSFASVTSAAPVGMEQLGQGFGYIVYRSQLPRSGTLEASRSLVARRELTLARAQSRLRARCKTVPLCW